MKKEYRKPMTESIRILTESNYALELPVSNTTVDDEAGKEGGGIWGEVDDENEGGADAKIMKSLWDDESTGMEE